MIYWIENIKDGSFVDSTESYEKALTIQDEKLKEGIDTYIRKEEGEEKIAENPSDTLTKEEVLDTIRNTFKDNEESIKHIDNIISNLAEIKKLEVANPRSTSFMTWILPILLLFGPNFNGLDRDLLNRIEDETDKSQL